jgi:hypothetical protein
LPAQGAHDAIRFAEASCGVRRSYAIGHDRRDKQIFRQLRDTWIALAHHGPNFSYEIIEAGIAAVEGLQSVFDQGTNGTIH